jgi:phage shock protein A
LTILAAIWRQSKQLLTMHGRAVDVLQQDVRELRSEVSDIKGNVSEIEGRVSEINRKLDILIAAITPRDQP